LWAGALAVFAAGFASRWAVDGALRARFPFIPLAVATGMPLVVCALLLWLINRNCVLEL
jgi:hypothetical protein